MTSILSRKKSLTLEDLVLRYGAIELQSAVSKAEFAALSVKYPELRMEHEKNGTITIMSPVKRGSGKIEPILVALLFLWDKQFHRGEVHGPSSGFDLPDGSTKSPDAAWLSPERLAEMPEEAGAGFIPTVPDFVAEIRSDTDRLPKLQHKMTDAWLANGVRLAWLIDPYEEKAYVYRQGREMETVEGFSGKKLSGEDVLPGFELPLDELRLKK